MNAPIYSAKVAVVCLCALVDTLTCNESSQKWLDSRKWILPCASCETEIKYNFIFSVNVGEYFSEYME